MIQDRGRAFASLVDWNPYWKNERIPDELLGLKRVMNIPFDEILTRKEIKTLSGIRRCGKSTILYQIITDRINKSTDPKKILMINFDDKVLAKNGLSDLIELYREEIGSKGSFDLFLDEVHNCHDWVSTIRKMYDLAQIGQVFVTDSSSKYISGEYTTLISGRTINIILHTLSFREYIAWRTDLDPDGPFGSGDIPELKKHLKIFMKWGGYPEVVLAKSDLQRKIILKEYLDTIIYKDIVERYNDNQERLKILVGYLLANPGSFFSPRSFSRKHNFSLETIRNYLDHMKEINFIHEIPCFHYSYNKVIKSHKKIYIEDTGLTESLGFRFSEGRGNLLESVVFSEINRWDYKIFYWSNGKNECDFVLKKGESIEIAIQVCHDLNEDNIQREISGIEECSRELKPRSAFFIIEHGSGMDTGEYERVELWRFLTDPGRYLNE